MSSVILGSSHDYRLVAVFSEEVRGILERFRSAIIDRRTDLIDSTELSELFARRLYYLERLLMQFHMKIDHNSLSFLHERFHNENHNRNHDFILITNKQH